MPILTRPLMATRKTGIKFQLKSSILLSALKNNEKNKVARQTRLCSYTCA